MTINSPLKTILISWLFLALSACVTTYDRPIKEPDLEKALATHVRLGMQYLTQNNLQSSRFHFNKALKIDAGSASAHAGLAELMKREGDEAMAEDFYRKAISLDGKFSRVRNNYGSFLYKQKRYREALVQFSKASTDLEYDRRALAFSNVGRCQAELGDYNAAETAFARAITLDPNSPGPYYALARIAKEKREYQAALQLLSQYHSLRPATPPSLDMQIQIARALGDKNLEASAMLKLKNIYPNSRQYRVYQRGGQL